MKKTMFILFGIFFLFIPVQFMMGNEALNEQIESGCVNFKILSSDQITMIFFDTDFNQTDPTLLLNHECLPLMNNCCITVYREYKGWYTGAGACHPDCSKAWEMCNIQINQFEQAIDYITSIAVFDFDFTP